MSTPAASTPPTGSAGDGIPWGELDQFDAGIIRNLIAAGRPVTREEFIGYNWTPVPDAWTAEHESELPRFLQDWSRFEPSS